MTAYRKIGICLAIALVCAAPAVAKQRHRTLTFDGDCQGSATVIFNPPLTNSPQPLTQHVRGLATCSGTLVDGRGRSHELTNARVVYTAVEQGDSVSCGAGIDSGGGALHFKRWGKLRFNVTERRAAALATLTFTGAKGGSATAVAHPTGDPVATVQQCGGSGLKKAQVDVSLSADSLAG
jgi:hypothetical protein